MSKSVKESNIKVLQHFENIRMLHITDTNLPMGHGIVDDATECIDAIYTHLGVAIENHTIPEYSGRFTREVGSGGATVTVSFTALVSKCRDGP